MLESIKCYCNIKSAEHTFTKENQPSPLNVDKSEKKVDKL